MAGHHLTNLSAEQIKARIAEGIKPDQVVHVNATRNSSTGFNFCYTLGMAFFGLPDLIIFGRFFDAEQLQSILMSVEENWYKNGERLGVLTDILTLTERDGRGGQPIPVEIQELRAAEVHLEYMAFAKHAYEADMLKNARVCQVLWPDHEGVLPTNIRYDAKRHPQLVLPSKQSLLQ